MQYPCHFRRSANCSIGLATMQLFEVGELLVLECPFQKPSQLSEFGRKNSNQYKLKKVGPDGRTPLQRPCVSLYISQSCVNEKELFQNGNHRRHHGNT